MSSSSRHSARPGSEPLSRAHSFRGPRRVACITGASGQSVVGLLGGPCAAIRGWGDLDGKTRSMMPVHTVRTGRADAACHRWRSIRRCLLTGPRHCVRLPGGTAIVSEYPAHTRRRLTAGARRAPRRGNPGWPGSRPNSGTAPMLPTPLDQPLALKSVLRRARRTRRQRQGQRSSQRARR